MKTYRSLIFSYFQLLADETNLVFERIYGFLVRALSVTKRTIITRKQETVPLKGSDVGFKQ